MALGAGTRFGNGGDDFNWLNSWRVVTTANALAQGLLVEQEGSAGGIIKWNGHEFDWQQNGD